MSGSRSGKPNVLLNLIKNQQQDIDKIYSCEKSIQIKVLIAY